MRRSDRLFNREQPLYLDASCEFCQGNEHEFFSRGHRGFCQISVGQLLDPRSESGLWVPPNQELAAVNLLGLGMEHGLYATAQIRPQDIVAEFQGMSISQQRANIILAEGPPYRIILCPDHSLFLGNDNCLASFANHSCEPNAVIAMERFNRMRRHRFFLVCGPLPSIAHNAEISYPYNEFAADVGSVQCLCGASNCIHELNTRFI
jgi:hypothetical protein